MKRATVTLPDELDEALEAYRASQEVSLPLTSVVQSALREYLAKRGFLTSPEKRPFRITSAEKGSGTKDVSIQHDRYFAET